MVCVHIFAILFRKKKYVQEKGSWSKISSRLLAYTYKCVLCTHIQIYVCRDLVHLDSSGPPGVSLTRGRTSKYPICAVRVCVCVYTHTHSLTYTPTRVKNRADTDKTPIFPSVKNNPPRQATSALID